jgi:hypothetical protein
MLLHVEDFEARCGKYLSIDYEGQEIPPEALHEVRVHAESSGCM